MKSIEIDDDLYAFIAGETKHIGESASDILRRLLMTPATAQNMSAKTAEGTPSSPAKATVSQAAKKAAEATPARTAKTRQSDDILKRATPDVLKDYTKRVDLFLFMLAQLHELHPQEFAEVEKIKGKNRVYFATSKEALLKTGSSTNPKQIPGSAFWVVTNNNTAKKVAMLEQVLQLLGYDQKTSNSLLNRFA
ncbi:replication initiation negative regulator SeqA [Salinimonas marina]|uniref:Negative modulator of initiation of replication n=1 Tax=Salinimonas marina TaxID=2785918 RepID=A0A7S9HC02_9ALTE|nr:replication initiation negative regulator SeqA [Salinimonas marina]QPG04640.1 replication initiation negative regulator SeqA [Salinimonas marina]